MRADPPSRSRHPPGEYRLPILLPLVLLAVFYKAASSNEEDGQRDPILHCVERRDYDAQSVVAVSLLPLQGVAVLIDSDEKFEHAVQQAAELADYVSHWFKMSAEFA